MNPARQPAVVVTRDEPLDGPLSRALERHGVRVLHWPTVGTSEPDDPDVVSDALGRLGDYRALVVSSARAVPVLPAPDARPSTLLVAAVGPSTARALREVGWAPDLVPDDRSGAGLARALLGPGVLSPGDRVLHPTSDRGDPSLAEILGDAGVPVDTVVAYRTVTRPVPQGMVEAALADGDPAAVTYTSPSAAHSLHRALPSPLWIRLHDAAIAAAIGPTTASALEALGVSPRVAPERSLEALAALATAHDAVVPVGDRSEHSR